MTPLASEIALELTLPIKSRSTFVQTHGDGLRRIFDELHFFEVTDIIPIVNEVGKSLQQYWERRKIDGYEGLTFLPAPKCWLERKIGENFRLGTYLQQIDESWAHVSTCWRHETRGFGFGLLGRISLKGLQVYPVELSKLRDARGRMEQLPSKFTPEMVHKELGFIMTTLVCINSPKIIGRRQHMPHRKVERELTKAFGLGKFPLRAWTELRLTVAKPAEIDDGESHEAHLTGRRALHFCRKHIRIRNGKLEYVSAHWRGDPALGIKQTRYKLRAPQSSAA